MTKHEKGKKLEKDFSKWMKENLDYEETFLRKPINGKTSERYYEVDIHGTKTDKKVVKREVNKKKIAIFMILFSVVVFSLDLLPSLKKFIASTTDEKSIQMLLILVGIMILFSPKKDHTIHAWVECKNLAKKVKRDHIQQLNAKVADVQDFESAKWYPSSIFIVSENGFDSDALNFAKEYAINCYQRMEKTDGFEKI